MGKIACCFGHRDVYKNISDILSEVVEDLITNKGVTEFWTGGMGDFDSKFGTTVNGFKRKYPDVTLTLIKPYFSNELNTNKEFYEYRYDGVYIPEELAGVHPKQAITKRNRWMVENTDYVVSFVYRDFGGAHTAVKYAKRLGKEIIDVNAIFEGKDDHSL